MSNGILRSFAVNLDYRNEVVFYELRRNGANAVNLVRWESRSRSAKTPTLVNSHLMVALHHHQLDA